jgi:hypothetical protein
MRCARSQAALSAAQPARRVGDRRSADTGGRPFLWLLLVSLALVSSSCSRKETPVAKPPPEFTALTVFPQTIDLNAIGQTHGLLVTGMRTNGIESDLTAAARFRSSHPAVATVDERGRIHAHGPGRALVHAEAGGLRTFAHVTVSNAPSGGALSFTRDVLPVLTKSGCSAGSCHAKPEGQNGFKLSVFAYDPKGDYREIVKEERGRRVFPAFPEESLLLKKATLAVDHEGGQRFEAGSPEYQTIAEWIRQGMPYQQPGEPALERVEVFPKERRYRRGDAQRLLVIAHYADGSTRDVTELAEFDSNDKEMAVVDHHGAVKVGEARGEGVIIARYLGLVDIARVMVPAERLLPESVYAALPVNNDIDKLVYERLKRLGHAPSEPCTDGEFIRRATLDAIGRLPTAEEARAFLGETNSDRRAKLIDRLLDHPAYADYWANKWADLVRPNPDRVGVKSVYVLDQWLRESFRENKPYDQFAREVLTAEGSNHRDGPVVIYRDRREPPELTTIFSQVFLGVRLECARCHNHPNEKWSQTDFYQMAAFFGPLKHKGGGLSPPISAGTEHFHFAPGGTVKHPVTGTVMKPKPPDGPLMDVPEAEDPRRALADWLTGSQNPFFARAVANRVWGEFFGRGIVEPVDDFRASNPPTNEPLLDALAAELVRANYDLKHLMRFIMRSHVYQLSSTPNESNVTDTKNFSRAYRRRLPAETLFDAVQDLTGVRDNLAGLPEGARAMQTWTYKIDSEFMDAFSRPNSSSDCPCERDRNTSVVQALHLMNSKALQSKLAHAKGRVKTLADSDKPPAEIVTELYLAAYSRFPTADELAIATKSFEGEKVTRQTATEDVLWVLLNSAEFVFNH